MGFLIPLFFCFRFWINICRGIEDGPKGSPQIYFHLQHLNMDVVFACWNLLLFES